MKHTKGPWIYKESKKGGGFAVYGVSDEGEEKQITWGGCGCCSDSDNSVENEGDARLMANSRNLLTALEAMCEEFRGYDLPYGSEAYAKAISAINQAKGALQ